MDRDMILERIDSLVTLCEKTEPDYKDSTILFTGQYVSAQEMHAKLARIVLENNIDEISISAREEIVNIMKEANLIYKMRKKMKKWMEEGKDLNAEALQMEAEIEDYLVAGQKINAIKRYREGMKDIFDEQVSLRDSKTHIDNVNDDLKRKGLVRNN
jgi:ribosomal protein L7/L12